MAQDARSKTPGWILSMLVGLVLAFTLTGIGAGVLPAADCPKCRGRGLHRLIDPQGAPEIRGVEFQPVSCDFCSDRKTVSLLRRWLWHAENSPAPPIYRN